MTTKNKIAELYCTFVNILRYCSLSALYTTLHYLICLNLLQQLKMGEHQLVLQHVTLQSSGIYSCQITLSGPPFDTVNKEKTLSVFGKLSHKNNEYYNTTGMHSTIRK